MVRGGSENRKRISDRRYKVISTMFSNFNIAFFKKMLEIILNPISVI